MKARFSCVSVSLFLSVTVKNFYKDKVILIDIHRTKDMTDHFSALSLVWSWISIVFGSGPSFISTTLLFVKASQWSGLQLKSIFEIEILAKYFYQYRPGYLSTHFAHLAFTSAGDPSVFSKSGRKNWIMPRRISDMVLVRSFPLYAGENLI